jgi:hypothetical protein
MEPTQPYAHYQNGVAERANRTIREKAAPLVQEINISGQLSRIISEKGTELLRVSSIPENLWPEAIQHAVWQKSRSPARALRKKEKKTPWEVLYDNQPTLDKERIWGSRAYVTLPLESSRERDEVSGGLSLNPSLWSRMSRLRSRPNDGITTRYKLNLTALKA